MQVTITGDTHDDWTLDPTIPVEFRIFALDPYTSADGTTVSASPQNPGVSSRLNWSVKAAATVTAASTAGTANTIIIPSLTVESTEDAVIGANAQLCAMLFRTDNGTSLGCYGPFQSFMVPAASATMTWQQIAQAQGPVLGFVGAPFFFKGQWSPATLYAAGNCVYDLGSTYIALRPNEGVEPAGSATNWFIVAQGATLSTSITTPLFSTNDVNVVGGVLCAEVVTPALSFGSVPGQGVIEVASPASSYAEILIADAKGNIIAAVNKDGSISFFGGISVQNGIKPDEVNLGSAILAGDTTGSQLLEATCDAAGNASTWYDSQGSFHAGGALVFHSGAVDASGYLIRAKEPLPPENLTPSTQASSNLNAATLNTYFVIGQSLASGWVSSPAISTAQRFGNLMLNGGNSGNGGGGGPRQGADGGTVNASALTALIPLVEATSGAVAGDGETLGETISSGALDRIALECLKRGVKIPNAATVSSYSGQPYSVMEQGSQTYKNTITCATAYKALKAGALARGIFVMHGETDEANSNTSYGADLVTWQANYNADINSAMGTSGVIPMYLSQEQIWGLYNHPTPTVALAMLSTVKANPTLFRMVCPKYPFPHIASTLSLIGENLHLPAASERLVGEYYGKAAMWDLLAPDTSPWTGVRPKPGGITLAGLSILIDFYVPVGPLAIDTALVSQPTIPGSMYGFEFTDGTSTSPTVAAVEIVGASSVLLTLSALPNTSGTMFVSYAYTAKAGEGAGPFIGPRGNLRDSDTTPALYDGRPLYNWCATFHEQVTA